MPGMRCVAPTRGVLRDAADRAAARPDRRRLREGAAARDRRAVRQCRIRLRPARGQERFLRIVFLAPLDELTEIYDLMAAFTADYLRDYGRR